MFKRTSPTRLGDSQAKSKKDTSTQKSSNPWVQGQNDSENPFVGSAASQGVMQKQGEEEEEMVQTKQNPLQKMEEEEEMVQTKQNPLQKMEEEEEMMQTKQNPLQKMEEEEEMVQTKQNPLQKMEEEEEMVQSKEDASLQRKAKTVQMSLAQSGSGQSLPKDVQAEMSDTFQHDFSDVKTHPNSAMAEQVGALAFTQGKDIHFAPGQYQPQSQQGKELLGHELTHVVQQDQQNIPSTTNTLGIPVNDDPSLEAQADQMGKQAAQAKKNPGSST